MAVKACPVCGSAVRIERLQDHLARVHPREVVQPSFTEAERSQIRRATYRAVPRRRVSASTFLGVLLVAAVIAVIAVALPYLPRSSSPPGQPYHWHPELAIRIDGQPRTIPASIGIDPSLWNDHSWDDDGMGHGSGGMAPLHTHDASGKIHAESRGGREYTVDNFFSIWGQSFSEIHVLGHPASPGHRVWIVVDGTELAPTESVVLRDGMQIDIYCGAA